MMLSVKNDFITDFTLVLFFLRGTFNCRCCRFQGQEIEMFDMGHGGHLHCALLKGAVELFVQVVCLQVSQVLFSAQKTLQW